MGMSFLLEVGSAVMRTALRTYFWGAIMMIGLLWMALIYSSLMTMFILALFFWTLYLTMSQ